MQKYIHTHTHTYKHTHTHTHTHILFWYLQRTAQSFKGLDTGSTQTLPLWNVHRRLINTWWQRPSSHFDFWPNRFLKCFFILFFSLHFLSETFRECLRTLVTVATDQDEIAMRKSWRWLIWMCDMTYPDVWHVTWTIFGDYVNMSKAAHTHSLCMCACARTQRVCVCTCTYMYIPNIQRGKAQCQDDK